PACDRCPVADDCVARIDGRVDELPGRAVTRARPVRDAVFAVLRDAAGAVLLEKRAADGIWGGLWCLPWLDARDDAGAYAARHGATESRELPSLRHAFTHFELRIEAVEYRIARTGADSHDHAWVTPAARPGFALPTPVRRLLDAVESTA